MAVVSIATRRRLARDPELEEACTKHAALTLSLYVLEKGTAEYRSVAARKGWWFDKIRSLNPGGAEIVSFPVPSEPKRQGKA